MSLAKFCAPTAREALRQVRERLGAEAVILANRAVQGGVEIIALPAQAMNVLLAPAAPSAPAGPAPASREPRPAAQPIPQATPSAPPTAPMQPAQASAPAAAKARASADGGTVLVREELRSMRRMLEAQFASLAWSESMRRHPLRMRLTGQMLAAGFSPALVRRALERLPDDYTESQARGWLHSALEQNLTCVPQGEDIVDRGGVYALVGPTGVGKTTTTAKLAARCAVKFGAQKLALITTDGYRVGAHDQLQAYGRILGVKVHAIHDDGALRNMIRELAGKHLVLIDTVGMGQRDARVADQLTILAGARIERLLLLNATSQPETLEEVVQAYSAGGLRGAVVSKADEAAKLGGVLDCVIRHRLPLHYVANGQRVPEDLHFVNPQYLLHRALKPAVQPTAFRLRDDELPLAAAQFQGPQAAARAAHA